MKWPKQSEMDKFYGAKGENQTSLILPYKMFLDWEPKSIVTKITCHEKVHDSLKAIFTKTLQAYGIDEIKRLRLDSFGGCLNVRKMRGGSAWSIHSWGTAVDLDPGRNQLKWGRDRAALAKSDYDRFWEIVIADEKWVSLGKSRNYDWMHFQAANL